ncbi:MAG: hypothetical protein ACM3X6_12655 [Patescibacteria group bacterium]
MERGVYFDAWYRDEHCYHPSLPMRRLQMVEDLEACRATVLVWSALGGGSISLPYLENEAFGPVDPRLRFYGYMNDSEFIRECDKRGIKVFGIVFEVQGWEFPVELAEDGRGFLGLNILRGEGARGWYGLREFSRDAYPGLFGRGFRDYFPDGLYNSRGEPVTDLLEECAARDFHGRACHARWVEIQGKPHICYEMCRNNPVWREYLKKVIEIQIDAGVHGVELDECEVPVNTFNYGGCFCFDCTSQFRAYLRRRQEEGALAGELGAADLSAFDYGRYLRERGVDYRDKTNVPYFREYWQFQMEAIQRYFGELADHARAYGRKNGREVLVSGNFFNLMPQNMPMESKVDMVITEMRQNLYRQANWYRYAAGFAAGRPLVVVENPYGGIVPHLAARLRQGRGYDLYRLFLLEAAAFGCNMAVPYGAWMGNAIRDSFHPPREVTREVQAFLAGREDLFSRESGAEMLVLYGYDSYYWRETVRGRADVRIEEAGGILAYNPACGDDPDEEPLPFWDLTAALSDLLVPYDVHILGNGALVRDTLDMDLLGRYSLVVLPDLFSLGGSQLQLLADYARGGGRVAVYGRLAENLPADEAASFLTSPNVLHYRAGGSGRAGDGAFLDALALHQGGFQVAVTQGEAGRFGLGLHKLGKNRLALHIVNYRYDEEEDAVLPADALGLKIRPGFAPRTVRAVSHLGGEVRVAWERADGVTALHLADLPLYTVVLLE